MRRALIKPLLAVLCLFGYVSAFADTRQQVLQECGTWPSDPEQVAKYKDCAKRVFSGSSESSSPCANDQCHTADDVAVQPTNDD